MCPRLCPRCCSKLRSQSGRPPWPLPALPAPEQSLARICQHQPTAFDGPVARCVSKLGLYIWTIMDQSMVSTLLRGIVSDSGKPLKTLKTWNSLKLVSLCQHLPTLRIRQACRTSKSLKLAKPACARASVHAAASCTRKVDGRRGPAPALLAP